MKNLPRTSSAEVVIPAGQNDVDVEISVADDAKESREHSHRHRARCWQSAASVRGLRRAGRARVFRPQNRTGPLAPAPRRHSRQGDRHRLAQRP